MLLKLLWESDYTPEQEIEQRRWKSVFKIKYPGRTKRRKADSGMKKTDQDLSAEPDPYDTKPIAAMTKY